MLEEVTIFVSTTMRTKEKLKKVEKTRWEKKKKKKFMLNCQELLIQGYLADCCRKIEGK